MAYASDSDLLARVPGAARIAARTRAAALSDAEALIDDEVYGAKAVAAHVYRAAHLLAHWTGKLGGISSGPVTSRKGGEGAVTYAAPMAAAGEGNLRSTKWGLLFLELQCGVVGVPV